MIYDAKTCFFISAFAIKCACQKVMIILCFKCDVTTLRKLLKSCANKKNKTNKIDFMFSFVRGADFYEKTNETIKRSPPDQVLTRSLPAVAVQ